MPRRSSLGPFESPRRVHERPAGMPSDLDLERHERQKALQEAALTGDQEAKDALVAMGLKLWWRRGRTIIKVKRKLAEEHMLKP